MRAKSVAIVLLTLLLTPGLAEAQRGRGAGPGAAGAEPNEGRGGGGAQLAIDRGIEFARVGGQPLALDLYRMAPSAQPSPVVIWIPDADATTTTRVSTPLVGLVSNGGIAVANIDYRRGPGTTLAMQLADVKTAVRWLRANGATYGVDGTRIGAVGFGLGGQLAALAGTTGDMPELEGSGPAGVSSRVQAVVDLAGPVTSGGLNPAEHASADSAPTLILHGTADAVVSTQESQRLVSALKVAGATTFLSLQMAVAHDLGALLSPVAMQAIDAFLDQHVLAQPGGGRGLSSFVSTPSDALIDPVALDLEGTRYALYPTSHPALGEYGSYRVYLPPDYEANPTRRYPVIYFLHGRSVDSKRPITAGYVTRADAAIRAGVMPPAIIILVNGLNRGWYMDKQDGTAPMESTLIGDLIPHVDATYRTIATRESRAIEGHSMGGFGALHIGFKYPELFSAVTGNSAALVANVTDDMGTQEYWESEHPAALAQANLDAVRRQRIRIIIGEADGLIAGCRALSEALTGMGVDHAFIPVPESPHNHDQLLQYETFDTMAFYGDVFGGR